MESILAVLDQVYQIDHCSIQMGRDKSDNDDSVDVVRSVCYSIKIVRITFLGDNDWIENEITSYTPS